MSPDCSITLLMPLRHFVPRYLRVALDSVTGQTCSRWRLLVLVEEQDADRFTELLEPYLEDDRVRLLPTARPGLPAALNTGMRAARTEYCAILLGDDFLAPDAIGVLEREIARYPKVDFFHSAKAKVDASGQRTGVVLRGAATVRPQAFLRAAQVRHLLCWKRERGLEIGGIDETFQLVGPDDYDFPWSMAEHGARFRLVPEVLYFAREHDDCYRLTTHPPLRARASEVIRMWRKHGVGGPLGATRALWSTRSYLTMGRVVGRLRLKAK